ncbi:hypothetical protein SSPO_091720 [Streptomyces antimycoticus]|uniref:Uncharacterized protein n=1 Tax=Streptomyces antimycoticus TaxID=68175 RepID=A0A499UWV8_9ACTN|nr:hypothetical protein [Streptomyces antimycoticus]BBJ46454.1 hypothetical protein SSPO_091720 [Streptomyces antimycoticus]
MDARYRAVFTDLRTDQAIDVLPLREVEYDDYLGKPGSLTATIPVPDTRMARRVRELVEGRTAVYLERGDEVCWGGIVWTLTPATDDRGLTTVGLQAATFDSYAGRRYIRANLSFTALDHLEIVRRLWDYMQGSEGGHIGVEYEPTAPPRPVRWPTATVTRPWWRRRSGNSRRWNRVSSTGSRCTGIR